MKTDKEIKEHLSGAIEDYQGQGLDLISDSVTYSFQYPEHPGIEITIKIGGMFVEELDYVLEGELQ